MRSPGNGQHHRQGGPGPGRLPGKYDIAGLRRADHRRPGDELRDVVQAADAAQYRELRADGMLIVDPQPGHLSCGEIGPGRMAEPATLFDAIAEQLAAIERRKRT